MAAVSLHAYPGNPDVAIKDIEYLTGDDFVQLHFKIDKMIPIPDVFYPNRNDNKHIVMRMNDVSVQLPKKKYTFDSSVIDRIEINDHQDIEFVDVAILLKEQVNYRVFTNQKGLYIEFPNIKNELTAKNRPQANKTQSNKPAAEKSTPPPSQPAKTRPAIPPPGKEKKPAEALQTPATDVVIKNIVVAKKEDKSVMIKLIMTGQPDFTVIPIPQAPARLAIDLKHTRGKQMKKIINTLNVKGFRGAYNSPTVFRVVFDLHYLKNYKVSPNKKGNVLQVEFFDQAVSSAEPMVSAARPPAASSKTAGKPAKPKPAPRQTGTITEVGETEVISSDDMGPASPITVKDDFDPATKSRIVTISNQDFFEDEKSQVAGQDKTDTGKPSEEDEKTGVNTQFQFLKKTIDEGGKIYVGDRMSFNFHNADLADVIKIIAKIAGKNIVLDPGISGRVTSQITDVPWDQALDLFLKVNKLDYVEEGNILRIGRVTDLAQEAEQRRKLKDARQMEGELSVITRTLSFSKVAEVAPLLKKQISKRGDILQDKRSNTLIISEVPGRIEVLDKLIDTLDVPNPQVSIEARVVETRANFVETLGIQWGYNFTADAAYGNQTTLKFPNSVAVSGNQFQSTSSPLLGPLGGYAVNLPAGGANSGTVFSIGNVANTFRLDVALSAMETKGQAKIISAPKTTTQNNVQATIAQGRMIPIRILQNNTVTVQFRPAVLELKVTPQITAEETIICSLEITNNDADFGNLVESIPSILTQSTKTTVMVDNGGTIVIGGIYKVESSSSRDGVPFFSKLPILGNLFRNKSRRGDQRELLIFITPRIVK
jgi:type IV pilus assembly protein PilQ